MITIYVLQRSGDLMLKWLLVLVVLLLFQVSPASSAPVSAVVAFLNQETGASIQSMLATRTSLSAPLQGVASLFSHEQITNLYQRRNFRPVWFDGWQLTTEAQVLLDHLRNAGSHGLCGNEYLLLQLEAILPIQMDFEKHELPMAPDNRAIIDLFLSQAFLTYVTHMVEGQVDPALAHVDWRSRGRKADLVKLLEYAVDNRRMPQVLSDLIPPHKEYRQLVEVLSQYQEISALGGWPKIPSGPTIRPGDHDDRVPLLRTLLSRTGDLGKFSATTAVYDQETVRAVRLFQARHGINDDGVVGAETLETFNVSVDERIRQIELNLERWRWMPKSFGRRHIKVNVADFSLEVFQDEQLVMKMPVIVGTQYRKTPVFSSQMTYLEFAPYWTVPPTILREDKLPKIKKNGDYLAAHNFRVISRTDENVEIDPLTINWSTVDAGSFPGLLRMDPGPWNPLGRVKFMFPNRFNVYLHDTNERYLFDNQVRSFSSGCIRVKQPQELAAFLLGPNFSRQRLQNLLEASVPEQIDIEPVQVHIQYWTAWVDRDNLMHFRSDVYFRDLDLDVALTEPAYRVLDRLSDRTASRLAKR